MIYKKFSILLMIIILNIKIVYSNIATPIEFKNSTSGGYIILKYDNLKKEVLNKQLNYEESYQPEESIKILANDTIDCVYEFYQDTIIKVFLPIGINSVDIKVSINERELFKTKINYNKVTIDSVSYFYTSGTFNLTISGRDFGEPFSIKVKQFNYGEELSNCSLLLSSISGEDQDTITCNISIDSNSTFDGITGSLNLFVGSNSANETINFVNIYSTHFNDKTILIPIMVFPCFLVLLVSISIMIYLKQRK